MNKNLRRQSPERLPRPAIAPRKTSRLVNPSGGVEVIRLGTKFSLWSDLYHSWLTIPWIGFLGLITLLYLAANTIFALLYLAGGNGIANAEPGSFTDAFFFSVQTMASIGYGAMYPDTLYTNIIVSIEALVGLLGIAMATGLMFARFSRPTARVLFSRLAVVSADQGVPTLMFRMANQRRNQILEAQVRLTLVRNEVDDHGRYIRRFYDLRLARSQSPIFALTWLAMHNIDETSPLHGLTLDDLDATEAELVVTLTGIDETFAQTIHARHSYIASEIFWHHRFADILHHTPEGYRAVDYSRFHDILPLVDDAPEQIPNHAQNSHERR
ncbi:MAG TPA: ion channel [Chroococcidiopsis sp.]